MKKIILSLTAAAIAFSSVGAFAADYSHPKCVPLMLIRSTPIIDDHTILMRMWNGTSKRIDMRGQCANMWWQGYSRVSIENNFCKFDILRVLGPIQNYCQIEKIVDIDKAEADALLASRTR